MTSFPHRSGSAPDPLRAREPNIFAGERAMLHCVGGTIGQDPFDAYREAFPDVAGDSLFIDPGGRASVWERDLEDLRRRLRRCHVLNLGVEAHPFSNDMLNRFSELRLVLLNSQEDLGLVPLRYGIEVNRMNRPHGPWFNHSWKAARAALGHISGVLWTWCVIPFGRDFFSRKSGFWPGAGRVDALGFDEFEARWSGRHEQFVVALNVFPEKPWIIGEATPKGAQSPEEQIAWFDRFFAVLRKFTEDARAPDAVHLLPVDWTKTKFDNEAGAIWGDQRFYRNPEVVAFVKEKLAAFAELLR